MRFVSFAQDGRAALGAHLPDGVVDLADVNADLPTRLDDLLGREGCALRDVWRAAAGSAAGRRSLDDLDLLTPISAPGKVLCLGLNYTDHAAEGGFDKPDYPVLFMRSRTSLLAHGKPMIRPNCSERLDYEAELAVIIGSTARHLAPSNALECVAGYAVFNDGSVRDYQRKTHQWTMGKNFDATGGFGPDFVSADEVPPGAAGLRIQSRLNGEVMQDANTSDMIFSVVETLCYLTEVMTLEPGDVIAMGTPAGVGHARRPPVWMKAGDVCEIEIEGIGLLVNPIENEVG
ncbi:MAG: fumarylacetoacetate hydrolase family protein [Pseudomonadota bacterium]